MNIEKELQRIILGKRIDRNYLNYKDWENEEGLEEYLSNLLKLSIREPISLDTVTFSSDAEYIYIDVTNLREIMLESYEQLALVTYTIECIKRLRDLIPSRRTMIEESMKLSRDLVHRLLNDKNKYMAKYEYVRDGKVYIRMIRLSDTELCNATNFKNYVGLIYRNYRRLYFKSLDLLEDFLVHIYQDKLRNSISSYNIVETLRPYKAKNRFDIDYDHGTNLTFYRGLYVLLPIKAKVLYRINPYSRYKYNMNTAILIYKLILLPRKKTMLELERLVEEFERIIEDGY